LTYFNTINAITKNVYEKTVSAFSEDAVYNRSALYTQIAQHVIKETNDFNLGVYNAIKENNTAHLPAENSNKYTNELQLSVELQNALASAMLTVLTESQIKNNDTNTATTQNVNKAFETNYLESFLKSVDEIETAMNTFAKVKENSEETQAVINKIKSLAETYATSEQMIKANELKTLESALINKRNFVYNLQSNLINKALSEPTRTFTENTIKQLYTSTFTALNRCMESSETKYAPIQHVVKTEIINLALQQTTVKSRKDVIPVLTKLSTLVPDVVSLETFMYYLGSGIDNQFEQGDTATTKFVTTKYNETADIYEEYEPNTFHAELENLDGDSLLTSLSVVQESAAEFIVYIPTEELDVGSYFIRFYWNADGVEKSKRELIVIQNNLPEV
jgi:Flp pilus assembly protein TadG